MTTRSLPGFRGWLFLGAMLCHAAAAPVFTSLSPLSGIAGTTVVLKATGLDAATQYQVRFGESPALITDRNVDQIHCVVPRGATSGPVRIIGNGTTNVVAQRFTVTRQISGLFNPPTGVGKEGYDALTFAGFSPVDPIQGEFIAEVPVDAAQLIWVTASESQPAFLAMVTPSMNGVVVDPQSTALALPFLIPGYATTDGNRATQITERLKALPAATRLAGLITAVARSTPDYLEDARIEEAWLALMLGIAPPAQAARSRPAPHTLHPRDLLLFNGLTPDYSTSIPATPPSLRATLEPVPDSVLNDARFMLFPEKHSNVDWFVELYGLEPSQFTGGRAGVERLKPSDIPQRLPGGPMQIGVVRAKLESKNFNLPGLIADKAASVLFGPAEEDLGQNSFKLRSLPPGVYVSQAYSGNLWYGTRIALPNSAGSIFSHHQSDEISRLGASWDWGQSLAANVTVALVDVISIVIPADALVDNPTAWHKLVRTVFLDVVKMAEIYYLQGQVDIDAVWDFVTTVSKSMLKGSIDLAIESLGKDTSFIQKITRFGKVGGKFIAKSVNVFKKISSGLQAAERMSGLLLPSSLALERSVMVIGDPFVPAIDSFSPRRGRGGDLVYLQGRNFPTAATNIVVTFCQFGSTADPTSVTASLAATVIGITPDSMTIVVPTNARATFPNGRAFLCVETATGRSSTTGLSEAYREYFFNEPPTPKAVANGPVAAGGLLHLTGTGFTPSGQTPEIVELTGPGFGFASVVQATESQVVIQLSSGMPDGLWSLRLRAGDEAFGNPIEFRVLSPAAPPPQGAAGLQITVTKLDMSNAPDGEISLLEAFHLANGTLGRPIEVHRPCESLPQNDPAACPRVRREIDFVRGADEKTGAGGGPNSKDTITATASATPILAGALPPPTSGDRFTLPLVLDGSNAAPDQAGWLLDGVSGVTLVGTKFVGFPGHGIHLRGGATGNVLSGVIVERAGRVGVYLEGDARSNHFNELLITNSGSDGLVFSGPRVLYNQVDGPRNFGAQPTIGIQRSAGWGVVFENGAQMNIVHTGPIAENASGGARVIGSTTQLNRLGRPSRTALVRAEIHSNGGPGVFLGPGVQFTTLAYLSLHGNRGDGIVLEGPDCAFNHLDGIMTSFRSPGAAAPLVAHSNEGSGIRLTSGAHDNLLGTFDLGLNFPFNLFGPDRDYNVLFEGSETSSNRIQAAYFGASDALGVPVLLPAGLGAVALMNGAHHTVVGHEHGELANRFLSWNRAGVLLDQSSHNRVYGNYMVGVNTIAGVIGIELRNGSRNNEVGLPGARILVNRGFDRLPIQFGNEIQICSKAGIALEAAGGSIGPNAELIEPNQVRNNTLRNNATGLLLGRQAWANRIGGPGPTDGNSILGSRVAEIRFEANPLPDRAWRNRFERNRLGGTSLSLGGPPPLPFLPAPGPLDHLLGPIPRVGLLIDATSTNQVFGESLTLANSFELDLVGAYLEGGSGVRLQGNVFDRNIVAGLIAQAGLAHEIGGLLPDAGNRFKGNGRSLDAQGAVIFSGGDGHRLRHAIVGGAADAGNRGFGLLLLDSSNNTIGDVIRAAGNEFTHNQSHGIWIQGPRSTGNQFGNNFIGITRKNQPGGNLGDGIRVDSSAAHNRIGGGLQFTTGSFQYTVPAGNEIAHNSGDGVVVIGPETIGNSILDNHITANIGLGIRLLGGNFNQPPPSQVLYDDFSLTGVAQDLAAVPAGSLIQAFSDPDPLMPEGGQPLGEGIVRPGGAFVIRLLRPPTDTVTLTSTHPTHRSTSPFGAGSVVPVAFRLERSGNGLDATLSPGASVSPVLHLNLSALNSDVRVHTLTVTARGSLAPQTGLPLIRVFRDTDRNGILSDADVPLCAPTAFSAQGIASLSLSNAIVTAGPTDRWFIGVSTAPDAEEGRHFQLEVSGPEDISARFTPGLSSARALAPFPIVSGRFTIGATVPRQTFQAWRQNRFTPTQLDNPAVSGELANPDSDPFSNLSEYAFGLDPLQPDLNPPSAQLTAQPLDSSPLEGMHPIELSYSRRPDPVDLVYTLEQATAQQAWSSLPPESVVQVGSAPEPGVDGLVRLKLQVQLSIEPPGPHRFYRVRVDRVP